MLDLAEEDINDRVVQYLLTDPVGDGGQWQMFINLVEKYGVVPKSVYPETVASSSTGRLNWLVVVKLREFATHIRKAVADGVSTNAIRVMKEEMLQDIYRIMVIYLGEPPSKFDWEVMDKSGKCISLYQMTPKKFMKEVVEYPVTIYMNCEKKRKIYLFYYRFLRPCLLLMTLVIPIYALTLLLALAILLEVVILNMSIQALKR